MVEWHWGDLRVFVGLNAKDNILVGTTPGLLAQEQTRGQAGCLAHDRHVVCPPSLTVFVHHSKTPAGGAVPDALLRPVKWRIKKNVSMVNRQKETNKQRVNQFTDQKGSAKTSLPSKE